MPRSRLGQEALAASNALGLVDVGVEQWVARASIVGILNLATISEAQWREWAASTDSICRSVAPRSAIVTASGILLTTLHVQTLYRRIAAADHPFRGYLPGDAAGLDEAAGSGV